MKKYFWTFLLIMVLFSSCSQTISDIKKNDILDVFRNNYNHINEQKEKIEAEALESFYSNLTDEEKIGQLFLISLDGNTGDQIKRIISTNRFVPGGYLLFAFNIAQTADETVDFLLKIKNSYIQENNIPPFISIDHEGGVVNRLRTICSKLPSQQSVANTFSVSEAEKLYELHGIQLNSLGIEVNLAPVVEVLTEENIQFLDDRSFGNLEKVISYSKAQINGMKKAGILPVLKHFPGNTNNDPHTGLPILNCSIDTLNETYLEPFNQLFDEEMTGVLVAHTVIPCIDEKPSCLSEKVLQLILNKTDNKALVFSDDLLMKALIKNGFPVEKSLIEAIEAGVNILMISNSSFDGYAEIVLAEYKKNEAFRAKVDSSVKKLLEWKRENKLLDLSITRNGFFKYKADVLLPESESGEAIEKRKASFRNAYEKAEKLYNEVWWSR